MSDETREYSQAMQMILGGLEWNGLSRKRAIAVLQECINFLKRGGDYDNPSKDT